MQHLRAGFTLGLFFALLAIGIPRIAAAQDMPPILAPLALPPVVSSQPTATSPSAVATIVPAPVAAPVTPAKKTHVAAVVRPVTTHRHAKSESAKKRFAAAHALAATHRVALKQSAPSFPPGSIVPPPGYYGPGPRERLVYGGPPPGIYGGWGGYRGRYSYYYP